MVRRRPGRRILETANDQRGAARRGWSALLAVLLLVAGAGLGAPSGFGPSLRGAPQAGSGAADGRDPALVRAGSRPAILAQRSGDPSSLPSPAEPALAPPPPPAAAIFAGAAAPVPVPAAETSATLAAAYEARGPPRHAA